MWRKIAANSGQTSIFTAVTFSNTLHVIKAFSSFVRAHRVLKPGAILRIVVPDLEGSCREYLRIFEKDDSDPSKQGMYEWILVELLDQLVRSSPSGELGRLITTIVLSEKRELHSIRLLRNTEYTMDSTAQNNKQRETAETIV